MNKRIVMLCLALIMLSNSGCPNADLPPGSRATQADADATARSTVGKNDTPYDKITLGGGLVIVRPIVLKAPSGLDVAPADGLPVSADIIDLGSVFVTEVWAQQAVPGPFPNGVSCIFADLSFDAAITTCNSVTLAPGFLDFSGNGGGSCDNGIGLVDEVGGCTFTSGLGITPGWVRIATVFQTADLGASGMVIGSQPAATAVSLVSYGTVPPAQIDFASSPVFSTGCFSDADCDDGNPCTTDTCDAGISCSHDGTGIVGPCDDGVSCTILDSCLGDAAGTCAGDPDMAATPCNDGDACTSGETCIPGVGICGTGIAVDCNDLNPCTDDACDATLGCTNTNNTTPCEDGNACTINDACLGGFCLSGPDTCVPTTFVAEDIVFWTHSDTEQTRDFVWTPATRPPAGSTDVSLAKIEFFAEASTQGDQGPIGAWIANDGQAQYGGFDAAVPEGGEMLPAYRCAGQAPNTCVLTIADAFTGASFLVTIATREQITVTISRVRYTWSFTPPLTAACTIDADCDDANACNGLETCDPATGSCLGGNSPVCDDGLFCNGLETCDTATGCIAGLPVDCDDGVPFTADSCNELLDICEHVINTALCDDGVFCNGIEIWDAVAGCLPGTPPNCTVLSDQCNTGICDEIAGSCAVAALPNGTACDNGDPCAGDTCAAGLCDPVMPCSGVAPPTNLTAQFGETANLSWTPSPDPDLDGYNVYRSTSSGGPYSLLTVLDLEQGGFDDESGSPGFYCYIVTALNTAASESATTNEVCGTTARN